MSIYRLNIIGNGRVALSLIKLIFDTKLDRFFKKITFWGREKKVICGHKLVSYPKKRPVLYDIQLSKLT